MSPRRVRRSFTMIACRVDAAGQLQPYFASCRKLAVYNPPDQVKNDWNDLAIGVCTGPSASCKTLWPHIKHYD
jgi:hypothetical protein